MQNDYILLSLVRTKNVGHIRDVRRLVVAMSRARLGLYVFGRFNLFNKCLELQTVFSMLNTRPLELHLLINEEYPTKRDLKDQLNGELKVINNLDEMMEFVMSFFAEKIEYWKVNRPEYIEQCLNPTKSVKTNEDVEIVEEEKKKEEEVEFQKINDEDEGLEDMEPEFDIL